MASKLSCNILDKTTRLQVNRNTYYVLLYGPIPTFFPAYMTNRYRKMFFLGDEFPFMKIRDFIGIFFRPTIGSKNDGGFSTITQSSCAKGKNALD